MRCKRCESTCYILSGRVRGKQRYKCKVCAYFYVEGDARRDYEREKQEALKLYLEGLGFRAIGRVLGVSNVSVLRWIRSYGREVKKQHEKNKKSRKKELEILEMDEMHHYVDSKKKNAGSGLGSIESKKS